MVSVESKSDFESLVDKNEVSVVDFWAEWCSPCKMLKPTLENLENQLLDKVKFVGVDIDKAHEIVDDFQVSAVPTLAILVNGKEVDRIVGANSPDKIKKKLLQYVAA